MKNLDTLVTALHPEHLTYYGFNHLSIDPRGGGLMTYLSTDPACVSARKPLPQIQWAAHLSFGDTYCYGFDHYPVNEQGVLSEGIYSPNAQTIPLQNQISQWAPEPLATVSTETNYSRLDGVGVGVTATGSALRKNTVSEPVALLNYQAKGQFDSRGIKSASLVTPLLGAYDNGGTEDLKRISMFGPGFEYLRNIHALNWGVQIMGATVYEGNSGLDLSLYLGKMSSYLQVNPSFIAGKYEWGGLFKVEQSIFTNNPNTCKNAGISYGLNLKYHQSPRLDLLGAVERVEAPVDATVTGYRVDHRLHLGVEYRLWDTFAEKLKKARSASVGKNR